MADPLLLHQRVQENLTNWRTAGYELRYYPAVGEILRWAAAPDGPFQLRPPQLMALECYWYLRLVLDTPHVADLYAHLFPDEQTWAAALALPEQAWQAVGARREPFLKKLQADERFVRAYRLESVRETMMLPYPSYIFALAMGVGKTVLIASLIAGEFALALEYPAGPFLHNALVFAPGRTIVEALRELIAAPYAALLPPHLHKPFAASVKFVVPQDGERAIPVLPGSAFNVIITNTEKIRIQKEKVRKSQLGVTLHADQVDSAKAEVANLRLQMIASLPNLGIFSDEAHHTYGRALNSGLKKIRKTVDYIAGQTTVRAVVNTTGTPYFGRQPLRDVVVSYGLAAGIRDGILKEVGENLVVYETVPEKRAEAGGHHAQAQLGLILRDTVTDFLARYGTATLPDGTPAKLAIYFPKTADIATQRPLLERLLIDLGYAPTLLLEHHTHCENKDDFDRFRTRLSPHRIALLVDRGTEGWDVPALFACALVRKLKTSNNFVLQAASRCLRQVPGNTMPARIYLSVENQTILARQLRETYGTTLTAVTSARKAKSRPRAAVPVVPPVKERRLPEQPWQPPTALLLCPSLAATQTPALPSVRRRQVTLWEAVDRPSTVPAHQNEMPPAVTVARAEDTATPFADILVDIYRAAVDLAACYHLPLALVYRALRQAYPNQGTFPSTELPLLRQQIEHQCRPRSAGDRD
ncbi:MAG TPA: DEAD/DEAH box helicase family protein [Caldilineaceae bacterium]|nr:DEAD/DEAH box helicase family protein [Caldilineaceae bacterium]